MRAVRTLAAIAAIGLTLPACDAIKGIGIDRDDGLLEGRGWTEVFRYEGTFRAGPDRDRLGGLDCGYEVECEPESAGTLVLEGAPFRVTCTGDALSFNILASDSDIETEDPTFLCHPDAKGVLARPYIQAGFWGAFDVSMYSISLRGDVERGSVRSGAWDIRFLAWAGPWRQPICGKLQSATPRGQWFSCIGEVAIEERMTHRDRWEPYDGGG